MSQRAIAWVREARERLKAADLVTNTSNIKMAKRLLDLALEVLDRPLNKTWTAEEILRAEA